MRLGIIEISVTKVYLLMKQDKFNDINANQSK